MLEKEEASGRIFGLDLMRAIAILIVMYMHSMFVLPVSVQRIFNLPLPAMDGVSVFFVLSGFLIGGILLRILEEQNFGPREIFQFWIRRWFRTLPNYVLEFVGRRVVLPAFAGADLCVLIFIQGAKKCGTFCRNHHFGLATCFVNAAVLSRPGRQEASRYAAQNCDLSS